jgi:S1-C subfamily serine protease
MLNELSNEMADAVAAAAPSVVQVQGRRRPASGVVYADDTVLTTMHAIGTEEGVRVRRHDQAVLDAELVGWDPTTRLAVLRVASLGLPGIKPADGAARVGQIAIAIARSWSNALTASAGIVSVIGGPLPTGPRRAIDQVIRTTAPMHSGFSGGAFIDSAGALIGVTTAATIRGLGVVIPTAIAWRTAATLVQHGRLRPGYLGIVGQVVTLAESQAPEREHKDALLVIGVAPGSPAAGGGVLVGDILLELDGRAVESPEQLMELLSGAEVGRPARLRVLRGGTSMDVHLVVAARPVR